MGKMRSGWNGRPRCFTILGWSNPFNTSISPQTFASVSFTFFFGMTFNATSFTMPLGVLSSEGLWPAFLLEPFVNNFGLSDFSFVWSTSAAAPRSANVIWSTGTCHVARFERKVGWSSDLSDKIGFYDRAYHHFSKWTPSKHLLDIIWLFLGKTRRLGKQGFCQVLYHLRRWAWDNRKVYPLELDPRIGTLFQHNICDKEFAGDCTTAKIGVRDNLTRATDNKPIIRHSGTKRNPVDLQINYKFLSSFCKWSLSRNQSRINAARYRWPMRYSFELLIVHTSVNA